MTTFTDLEVATALYDLQRAHVEAQQEARQAVKAATSVSATLLQASRGEARTMMVRCERCGLAFVPVACPDGDHAHCPDSNCGEPYDLTAAAAQETVPTSGDCFSADYNALPADALQAVGY